MQTKTHYLGLELEHPVIVGASSLVDDLDLVRKLEDAGMAAIIMRSLYEEEITGRGPRLADEYLEQLRRTKEAVDVPVLGSLNGNTPGGWTKYAAMIEQAGADALELNTYHVSADPAVPGHVFEDELVELVRSVSGAVRIQVAVKLSPFFTALPHLAQRLDMAGAKALVIFNRFYQPDLDVEGREVQPVLRLSDSSELPARLRWLAILSHHVATSLAVTGGVHSGLDAVKAVAAGADVVQTVSSVVRGGPQAFSAIRQGFLDWLAERDYETVDKLRGSMNLLRVPDPRAFERGNYMRILQGWKDLV